MFWKDILMLELEDPGTLRTILDNLHTGLCVTDREQKIVLWNRGAEKITGYMRHTVLGRVYSETLNFGQGKNPVDAGSPADSVLRDGVAFETQVYLQHKAGHLIPVHVWAAPIRDSHGSVIGVSRAFEEKRTPVGTSLESLAAHGCLDNLSGLPNHRFTEFHLRESLLTFSEYRLAFGILCIAICDIDRVRENYGQEATFAMLHMVGQTAAHVLGNSTFLGLWRDDEFISIVMNCDGTELEKRAADVQRAASASRIKWWDDQISTVVIVAHAMVWTGDTLETLLERAERQIHQRAGPHPQIACIPGECGQRPGKG
jgi:PAS domain S-box-containing protein